MEDKIISLAIHRAAKNPREMSRIEARHHNKKNIHKFGAQTISSQTVETNAYRLSKEAHLTRIAAAAGFDTAKLFDDLVAIDYTHAIESVGRQIGVGSLDKALEDKDLYALIGALLSRYLDTSKKVVAMHKTLPPSDEDVAKKLMAANWAAAVFWGTALGIVRRKDVLENKTLDVKDSVHMLNTHVMSLHFAPATLEAISILFNIKITK